MAAATRMTALCNRTRILFILDEFPDPGAGTEGQFWILYRGLDRSRFDPQIVLLRPSTFLESNLPEEPPIVLGITSIASVAAIWKATKIAFVARWRGYRIAHLFFNDCSILFPPLLRLSGIATVVSRRDLGFWYDARNLRILRLVGRCVRQVVANCEAVRDVVARSEGIPVERICVIYNGSERINDRIEPASRAVLGIPDDCPILVMVANLRRLKRVADAIEALSLLPESLAGTHLIVAGEDRPEGGTSHKAQLRQKALELGVLDRVHFTGKLRDPLPVIALADVCLLCSETEGLSNAVIEYMMMAKPSVVTDAGGNTELQVEGVTGFVVAVGDIRRIADRVAGLLMDSTMRRRLGLAARQRVVEKFSASSMIEGNRAMYERILRGDTEG